MGKGQAVYQCMMCGRRIADQSGHFTMEDYQKWLKNAGIDDLSRALRRLAQLNQSKVYLFWKRSSA